MIPFTKMHGAGNDYVYLDGFSNPIPDDLPAMARHMSDRHKGIGSDGLIVIAPCDSADAEMIMFNADGSRAEMCGNGIRCVAKYLYDERHCPKPRIDILTGAGTLSVDVHTDANDRVQSVTVDMGQPRLPGHQIPTTLGNDPQQPVIQQTLEIDGREILATCVSMGNPHCVVFVDDPTDEWVLNVGPKLETHPAFPDRTNVEFVQVVSPSEVIQRTWERGSGETLACGTGAAAVCVAGVLTGRTGRKITVHLRGGDLQLHWDETSNHVFKTGPAVRVFDGVWHGPYSR